MGQDAAEELLKKIKSNQPEDLTSDNDYLNTIPKGDMIKAFMESLLERPLEKDKEGEIIPDIQMIALYGDWGSGKTSLMKYIKSKLDEENENFTTVFFESWQFENDDNLALSLLNGILKKNEKEDNIWTCKDKIVKALRILTKSAVAGYSFGYNASKAIETAEKEFKNDSFHEALDVFKTSYRSLENNILKDIKNENRKLVVFIDDLDRCEPENVLKLLAAIKLFFTYGQKTIFICGLDKDAVDEAVKIKYGEVIKSGEYMEKVFDISFDMPKPNIGKMIDYYFKDLPENDDDITKVREFFDAMHFTNPRHIKKVLNKYLIVRYYQLAIDKDGKPIDKEGLIPDQSIDFFRYLTLFVIMLYKFEPENFKILQEYDEKLTELRNHIDSEYKNVVKNNLKEVFLNQLNTYTFKSIMNELTNVHPGKPKELLENMLSVMFGIVTNNYKVFSLAGDSDGYNSQFTISKNMPAFFTVYCQKYIRNHPTLWRDNNLLLKSEYVLWNIFDMAERYL